MKFDSCSPRPFVTIFMRLCLFAVLFASSLPHAHAQRGESTPAVVHLEQIVNAAMEEAGNDAVAIQAALGKVMADTRPTPAGLKAIASAAMRKVATFNQHALLGAVSEGIVVASLNQAKSTGLDPMKTCASVGEGLVGSAMGTTSRRGGNSIVTATVVAQATAFAVVKMASALQIPVANASNAAAFGGMTATLATSIDYGHDIVAATINVSSGITEGVVRAAISNGEDHNSVGQASLTGSIDSIHVITAAAQLKAGPVVEGARAGYQRGLEVALGRVPNSLDDEDPNRDILRMETTDSGSTGTDSPTPETPDSPTPGTPDSNPTGTNLETMTPPKTIIVQNAANKDIEIRLESSQPLPPGLTYIVYKNGEPFSSLLSEPHFVLPTTQPTEETVGVYSMRVVDQITNQSLAALPTTFTLLNSDLPQVSPYE
jgi:hypothetical protein